MKFKVTMEITESQLKNLNADKVIPIYKTLDDDVTDEINWIVSHEKLIIGAVCEFVYDTYSNDFADKKTLLKNSFYGLIKSTLGVETKNVRLSTDDIKYCFVKKH